MLFIGIDQSITQTAITVMRSPSDFNTYTFEGKGSNYSEKLQRLHKDIGLFLVETHRKNSLKDELFCCMEGGSFSSQGRLFTLGQLSGVILSTLFMLQVPYIEVPPSTLKKFISGRGDSNKKAVMKSILQKYKVRFSNDNKADSYVLALMAYAFKQKEYTEFFYREELEWVKKQKEKESLKGKTPLKSKKKVYRRKKGEF